MKKIFFTGTGTNVGKTYVLCQWLKKRALQGIKVHGLKPIASGSEIINNQEIWLDEELIKKQNSQQLPVTWYRFKDPIAPHIAAKNDDIILSSQQLIAKIAKLDLSDLDELYIEGAGGLMVPLNYTETWIDFIKQANLQVILVVGMTLGCINHALLTEQQILANNLNYLGWISNAIDPSMLAAKENLDTLKQFMRGKYLAHEPYSNTQAN
jgi:dethiobiotin synthetase